MTGVKLIAWLLSIIDLFVENVTCRLVLRESRPSMLIFGKPSAQHDFEGLLRDMIKITTLIKSRVEVEILPGEISLCPALYNAPVNSLY